MITEVFSPTRYIVVSRLDVAIPQVISHRLLVWHCGGIDRWAAPLGRIFASTGQADSREATDIRERC